VLHAWSGQQFNHRQGTWRSIEFRSEPVSAQVVDAVAAITKKDGRSFLEFPEQINANEMALGVDPADMADKVSKRVLSI
jgi:hypothetical protein